MDERAVGLSDKWAETIYRIAMSQHRLKVLLTPVGLISWFSLGVLLVFASLWLDRFLPRQLALQTSITLLISVPLLLIGSIMCLWTVSQFFKARGSPVPVNPPQKLVTTGLYSYSRNPMVFGWSVMLFGLGILLNSLSLIFILTPLFVLLNILYLKTVEEKEMEKKFGKEYLNYKKSVPMFIPRFGKK